MNVIQNKSGEGEFLVKEVMSWEGVRREFGLRYLQSTSNQTPNSLPNPNFLTKNSPQVLDKPTFSVYEMDKPFMMSSSR